MKKTISLLIALVAINAIAQPPNTRLFVDYTSHVSRPTDERCTGGGDCGSENSLHPKKIFFDFNFVETGAGVVAKNTHSYTDLGPRLRVSTMPITDVTESWYSSDPNNGTQIIEQLSPPGGSWTNTITGIDVCGIMEGGSVARFFVNESGGYYNEVHYATTSRTKFKLTDGDNDYVYRYRIYFYVQPMVIGDDGSLVDSGHPLRYDQIGMASGLTVSPAEYYQVWWCSIEFDVVRTDHSVPYYLNITPSATYPDASYYSYGFSNPVLIKATPIE